MIKRSLLIFICVLISGSAYTQQPGGFSNSSTPGQDLFRFDASVSYTGSADQMTDLSAAVNPFVCTPNKVLPFTSAGASSMAENYAFAQTEPHNYFYISSYLEDAAFTFEALVHLTTTSGTGNNYLLNFDNTSATTYKEGNLLLSVNTGRIKLSYRNPSSGVVSDLIICSPVLTSNTVHVAVTKSSTSTSETLILYADGVNVGDYTVTKLSTDPPVYTLDFDLAEGSGSDSFIGEVDEVRVWTTTLSATVIKDYAYQTYTTAQTGLKYYFTFDHQADVNDQESERNEFHTTGTDSVYFYHLSTDESSSCDGVWATEGSFHVLKPGGTHGYKMGSIPASLQSSSSMHSVYAYIKTSFDVTLPQVVYKEGNLGKGVVVYISGGNLKVSYWDTSFPVTGDISTTVSASTDYLVNLTIDNSSQQINLYLNGILKGTISMAGTIASVSTDEISFGGFIQRANIDTWIVIGMNAYSFKGELYEALIRLSENKSQQIITTNYFSTKYHRGIPAYGSGFTNDDTYRFDLFNYEYVNTPGTGHAVDPAGIGYDNSTVYQSAATSSHLTIQTNYNYPVGYGSTVQGSKFYLFWAHNGGTQNYDLVGYNHNADNAPLNVRTSAREWKVTATQNYTLYSSSVYATLRVPASDFPSLPESNRVAILIDDDGNYRSGSRTVVLTKIGTDYVATDVLLMAGVHTVYMKIGILNQFEYAGSGFTANTIYLGKAHVGYEHVSEAAGGLLIDNPDNLKAGDYLLVQDDGNGLSSTSVIAVANQAGTSVNVTAYAKTWRWNVYGTPGTVDLRFTGLSAPSSGHRYVILLDNDGVFGVGTTTFAMTQILSDYKAFFRQISDGTYMKVALAPQTVLQSLQLSATSTPVTIGDDLFLTVQQQDDFAVTPQCLNDVSASMLKVSLNTGSTHITGDLAFTASVSATVTLYNNYGMTLAVMTYNPSLNINASEPEATFFADIALYYPQVKKIQVHVDSYSTGGSSLAYSHVQLTASIEETQRVKLPPVTSSLIVQQQYATDASVNPDAGGSAVYAFSWLSGDCPMTTYQFQLLRLYREAAGTAEAPDHESLSQDVVDSTVIDWSRALTLETDRAMIRLMLMEGSGYYAWRVRPIGNYYPAGVADSRNWGNWSTDNILIPSVVTGLSSSTVSGYGNTILYYQQLEQDKNFIYQRSFTEGGNIHESITYATGLLQSKQTISRLNGNGTEEYTEDKELVVSQSLYDFAGRAALNSLPTPVSDDNDLSYREAFLLNSGNLYTASDFDTDGNYLNPSPLDGGDAHTYYSNSNPDGSIPSADGYAFSRQLFNSDGTNQVVEQSGPGVVHKLTATRSASHTVKVRYSGVTADELILVFGDEAPDASSVFKTITTDQNNITSITYTDKEGKVLATCLAKRPEGEFTAYGFTTDALGSETDTRFDIDIESVIINNQPYGDGGLKAYQTYSFSTPTEVKISYTITPALVAKTCGNYCAKCGYELLVQVINAETNEVDTSFQQTLNAVYSTGSSCDGAVAAAVEIYASGSPLTLTLDAGTYIITKQVVPSRAEANTFAKTIVDGEKALMEAATLDLANALEDATKTRAEMILAYRTFINKGYSDNTFDLILRANNKTQILTTVGGSTSAEYSGTIEEGQHITVMSSCCTLDMDVALPAYNPCEDAGLMSLSGGTVLSNYVTDDNGLATALLAVYTEVTGHAITGAPLVSTAFDFSIPGHTVTDGGWTATEFSNMIVNLNGAAPGAHLDQAHCYRLWDCWQAAVMAIAPPDGTGMSAGTAALNTPEALTQSIHDQMPKDGTWASQMGTNLTIPAPNMVETFLDCYGRNMVGFTNNLTSYKENAFRVFYRYDVETITDCDKMFCTDLDLEAPLTPESSVCRSPSSCTFSIAAITSPSISGVNVLKVYMDGGTTPRTMSSDDYLGMKGCLTGVASFPTTYVRSTELTFAKLLPQLQAQQSTMVDRCRQECENKDPLFRGEMNRFFDPGHSGSYTYFNTGTEAQPNGDFSAGGSGWYYYGGSPYGYVSAYTGKACDFIQGHATSYTGTGYYGIQSAAALSSGHQYRLEFTLILGQASRDFVIYNGGTEIYRNSQPGTISESVLFTAGSGPLSMRLEPMMPGTAFSVLLDNVSIKEISLPAGMSAEDVCCMARSLTDYCKQQCTLDLVTADCDNDTYPDKFISIGTPAQLNKWLAITSGTFQLSERPSGGCDTGWDEILPDINTTPGKCLTNETKVKWDASFSTNPVREMVEHGGYYWAIAAPNIFIIDKSTGVLSSTLDMSATSTSSSGMGSDYFPFIKILFASDGSFYLGGTTSGNNFAVAKFTAAGAYTSTYTNDSYDGSHYTQFYDMILEDDNTVVMVGGYDSDNGYGATGTLSTPVLDQFYAVKISSMSHLWDKAYDNTANNPFYPSLTPYNVRRGGRALSIVKSHTAGEYIIGGEYSVQPFICVMRVLGINGSSGTQVFEKIFPTDVPHTNPDGVAVNSAYVFMNKILQTSDGYIFGATLYADTAPLFNGTTIDGTAFHGGGDMYLLKTDNNFNKEWNACYGGWSLEIMTNLQQLPDKGYILNGIGPSPSTDAAYPGTTTGTIDSPGFGFGDYYLIRVSENGVQQWDASLGGGAVEGDGNLTLLIGTYSYGTSVIQNPYYGGLYYDPADNQIVTGSFSSSDANPTPLTTPALGNRSATLISSGDGWIAKTAKGSNTSCLPKDLCIKWIPPQGPVIEVEPPITKVPEPEVQNPMQVVRERILTQIAECKASRYDGLVQAYLDACMNGGINDLLTVRYKQRYHHYTLYYYDRAGSLVRTVPPAGVVPLNLTATGVRARAVPPAHTLVTQYGYNSIGQLVYQSSPDGGVTNFKYNSIGQLRFSQNARQAAQGKYSYTKYDALGRILEVGESALASSSVASFAALSSYADAYGTYTAFESTSFPALGNAQQTFTVYTQAATQVSYLDQGQSHLRNRVSFSYTYALNGERAVTYYSYDPHGNVNWLMQEIPGQSRNTIGYDYDLISNKVLMAKYNEGFPDAFYHKYEYDADNRVTKVLTSRDKITWDADARYEYYKHGPLRLAKIGEDSIQKIDYTYTVQGWLKAINDPTLLPVATSDDGKNAFAGDEYGMVLNYYKGDFTRTASVLYNPVSAAVGTDSRTLVSAAGSQLFNGNISSWVSRVQEEYRNAIAHGGSGGGSLSDPTGGTYYNRFTTANEYRYDDLNRIVNSTFAQHDSSVTGATDDHYTRYAGGKYSTAYSYDGNGNILTLKRYSVADMTVGASASLMDDLSYSYTIASSNQLNNVRDAVTGGTFSDDVDDYNPVTYNRYTYDATGNLVTDRAEGITIEWTVYGKVAAVKRLTPTANSKPEVRYTYDAIGNRIKKELNMNPYDGSGIPQRLPADMVTTFYVRDASGNVMSIYERTNSAAESGYYNAVYTQEEIPLYGSSRLGMYQPGEGEKNVMTRKFATADLDHLLYAYEVKNRLWYDPVLLNYITRDNVSLTSTTGSVSVSSSTITGGADDNSGILIAVPRYTFSGTAGNGVSNPQVKDISGSSPAFNAYTAKNYYGTASKLVIENSYNQLMKGAETLYADGNAQIAACEIPGSAAGSLFYVITRDTARNLVGYTVTPDAIGYGSSGSRKGEVSGPYQLAAAGSDYYYGTSFLIRENKATGKTLLYATRYTKPHISADSTGKIEFLVFDLPGYDPLNGLNSLSPQIMCSTIGLLEKGEQQGELAFSAQGDKLIYYSGKKRLGWFSHQKSVIFTYQLGYDGKMAKNVLTTTIKIPPTDASLPGSSVGISEDGRFLYYTKDQLYKTGGYAAHTARYDTRNGNHTIISNYAGDLRYTFVSQGDYSTEGMLLIQADTKSQTGHSYEENDAGTTIVDAHAATLGSSSGRVHHLPAQVYVLFGMSAREGISVRHTGQKRYELSDHLGNVTVVVTDQKKATVVSSTVRTQAKVQSYTNYYAFGMNITARSGTDGPGYRYGFNGKEKDPDMDGGACYDYGFRIYDARIAKFLSVDPLSPKYPELTSYQFASNSPIMFIDIDGLEGGPPTHLVGEHAGEVVLWNQMKWKWNVDANQQDGGYWSAVLRPGYVHPPGPQMNVGGLEATTEYKVFKYNVDAYGDYVLPLELTARLLRGEEVANWEIGIEVASLIPIGKIFGKAGKIVSKTDFGEAALKQLGNFFKNNSDVAIDVIKVRLQSSIKSFDKLIVEHTNYIANPKLKYGDAWDTFTPERKNNAIHHWQQDIKRAEANKLAHQAALEELN